MLSRAFAFGDNFSLDTWPKTIIFVANGNCYVRPAKKQSTCFGSKLMSREVSCPISVVKSDSLETAFEDAAAILTGIECKYMSLCLLFSILPNFYEIKTNFPQNYNV